MVNFRCHSFFPVAITVREEEEQEVKRWGRKKALPFGLCVDRGFESTPAKP
jgi:hypothetical protein